MAEIPLNPLSAAFRGFQTAQQRRNQVEQQEAANQLTEQLRQIQLLNAERQLAQSQITPQQSLQQAITEALIKREVGLGGIVPITPQTRLASTGPQAEELETMRAIAETQAGVPSTEEVIPLPGVSGFGVSPSRRRREQQEATDLLRQQTQAKSTPGSNRFQVVQTDQGPVLQQISGAEAATTQAAPIMVGGERVKSPVSRSAGRSILAEDSNGRLTNIVLQSGQSLPEGFKEHTKPSRSISDPASLRKEFNALQTVKDFREITPQFQRMQEAIDESKRGGTLIAVDQTLINTFNKILDPDSVVREGEYARTAADQSVLDFLKGKLDPKTGKLAVGGAGLTPENRQAMIRMAERFVNASRSNFDQTARFYEDIAESGGLDPRLVIQGMEEIRGRSQSTSSNTLPPATNGSNQSPAPIQIRSIRLKK